MTRTANLSATTVFLTLLFVPGTYHLAYGLRSSDLTRWQNFLATDGIPGALRKIESDFDQRFLPAFAAKTLAGNLRLSIERPLAHFHLFKTHLHSGVMARQGTDGFLFYLEDMRTSTGDHFLKAHPGFGIHAADAIIDLRNQLAARNIHLLVVPIPAKAAIYPDKLDPSYDPALGPDLNPDQVAWIGKLQSAGVDVLDLTNLFWARRFTPTGPLYFPTDSHWSHQGMRLAAIQIANHLRPLLGDLPPSDNFKSRSVIFSKLGDLNAMSGLDDPPTQPDIHDRVVQLYNDNGLFLPGNEAPILVIGDSYAGLLVDQGAGLCQQITNALKLPVQSAALAGATGDGMRAPLHTQPQLLVHKRIVIFAFTTRLIMHNDWHAIPLAPQTPNQNHK